MPPSPACAVVVPGPCAGLFFKRIYALRAAPAVARGKGGCNGFVLPKTCPGTRTGLVVTDVEDLDHESVCSDNNPADNLIA
jgi:hypothetical protein